MPCMGPYNEMKPLRFSRRKPAPVLLLPAVSTQFPAKPHSRNLSNFSSNYAVIINNGFDSNSSRPNSQLMGCFKSGNLSGGRQLFDEMPQRKIVSTNFMISSYVKSGNLSAAKELFDGMVERNAVSWTIMIGGYVQSNQFREGVRIFAEMCRWRTKPDYVTFTTLLSGCNEPEMAKELRQVHTHVIKQGCDSTLIVCNSLVDSYCKTRRLDLACRVFNELPKRDSVTYNALMTGHAKDGLTEEAIRLFLEMLRSGFKPSDFTLATVLCSGIGLDDASFGQQVHGFAVKTNFVCNVFVGNSLLDFYSKHDCVNEARKFFDRMPELDDVSYNVIISAHSRARQFDECIDLFQELQRTRFDRRNFPFATMLSVAANSLDLRMGQQLHSHAIVTTADSEVSVANSLVDMYAKCGRFKEAERLFLKLGHKSIVPWTARISANIQNGLLEEALELYSEMCRTGVSPDQATFASVLKASASLASISLGKQLHSCIIRSGFMSNVHAGSAVLDMYAKCGSVKDAIQIFEEMPERNVVSWNALILAYAQNGEAEASLKSFQEMILSGYQPDSVSFLCVLSACCHCGLVEEGWRHFTSMTEVYKIVPKREHYASMIDLLCRSGQFSEAEKFMTEMPFEPDEVMWSSVLNSCRTHKNHELAKRAAEQLFNKEVLRDGAPYLNMSSILAAAGQWDGVAKVKKAMRTRGVNKLPAYSWVEM